MAHQSGLPRGKSWSTGSAAGTLSSSATRWIKSERLKKLEQDFRTSSSEIETLEAEVRDLSATFEKLKKVDAKRVERMRELVDDEADDDVSKKVPASEMNLDVQDGKGLNGEEHNSLEEEAEVEKSSEGQVNEEVEGLRSEHEAAQSEIQSAKASLEQKRAELEALSQKLETLTELISKEERLVQAAEIDESMQQSVVVEQEMRSPSEDLGLMEGLKESKNAADSSKPGFTSPQGRVFIPVTQLRSRSLFRNSSQNGSGPSANLGRSISLGDPPMASRSKEPAEFEEKEGGGNRKRHKNSNFEQERERLYAERAKLEVEAKEKRRLLESLASFSAQEPSSEGALGSSPPFRDIVSSPSSVFEGFGETPSMSRELRASESGLSNSSDSSEFSIERLDSSSLSSAVKRLDFESFPKEDVVGPFPVGTTSKGTSDEMFTGNGFDHDVKIVSERSVEHEKVAEAEFSLEQVEENLPSENGNEESHAPAVSSDNDAMDEISGPGDFSRVSGTKEIRGLEVEVSSPNTGGENCQERTEIEMVGMQGPEVSSPDIGTEGRRKSYLEMSRKESAPAETKNSTSEGIPTRDSVPEAIQDPASAEIPIRESVPEEIQDPTSAEILIRESEPKEIQDPTSDETFIANFEREVLEVFSLESANVGKGADAEKSLEETELHSLPGAVEDEVEEIDIPTDEFDSFREEEEEEAGEGGEEDVLREEDVMTTRNRVEEIDVPEEDILDFDDAEPAEETSDQLILKSETGVDEVERPLGPKSELSAYDDGEKEALEVGPPLAPPAPDLQENGLKSAEPSPKSGQYNAEEMSDERQNRRLEAENQIIQLSSQLSLLQKQVEETSELHEKSKNDSQQERTSAEKEQLRKQVSFFADEVRGLRQNIDDIQRILHKEGGDFSSVEHWAKDLHSKCADQSAQLEHLGKQVSMLGKYLEHHLQLRVDIDGKLDKQAHERHKVEAQLTDLSKALAITVSTIEREEVAVGELIEHQKHLLVDQLTEAEKLRHIAEVRVQTLNNQIAHLEMVCDAAKNIQAVTKYQDKAFKHGIQTLVQLVLLALGIFTLYSRVAEPFRPSHLPT